MTFTIGAQDAETTVVTIRGELDISNVDQLDAAMTPVIDRRVGRLILDVGELEFADSSRDRSLGAVGDGGRGIAAPQGVAAVEDGDRDDGPGGKTTTRAMKRARDFPFDVMSVGAARRFVRPRRSATSPPRSSMRCS